MNIEQVKSLEGLVPIHRWMKKKEWQNYRHVDRIMQSDKPSIPDFLNHDSRMHDNSDDDEEV